MYWLSMLLSDDTWDNRSHLFTLHTMAAKETSLVLSNQIPIVDKKVYRFTEMFFLYHEYYFFMHFTNVRNYHVKDRARKNAFRFC